MTVHLSWVFRFALLMIVFGFGAKVGFALDEDEEARIRDALNLPGQAPSVQKISDTVIPGIFEVQFVDSQEIIYMTSDGRYFFSGDILSLIHI